MLQIETTCREVVVDPSETPNISIDLSRNEEPFLPIKTLGKKDLLGVVTGVMLGNGYAKSQRLVVQHTLKNKAYALYKAQLLSKNNQYPCLVTEQLAVKYPYIKVICYHKVIGRVYEKMYVDNKKTLSEAILNQLGAIGLAIWYMDRGTLTIHRYPDGTIKSREIYWSTESFDYAEHLLMQSWFKRRYGINIKILSNQTGHTYRAVLNATNANRLIAVIKPYIIPSRFYKIDMCYSENLVKTLDPE